MEGDGPELWLGSGGAGGGSIDDILAGMGTNQGNSEQIVVLAKSKPPKPPSLSAKLAAPSKQASAPAVEAAATATATASPFTVVRKVKRKAEEDLSGGKVRVSKVSKVVGAKLQDTESPAPTPPQVAAPAPTQIAAPDPSATRKEKHKTLSMAEDPMQYHAKPKDLSQNALKRPREAELASAAQQNQPISNRRRPVGDGGGGDKSSETFARTLFGNLSLNSKIKEQLELATDAGGFGLTRSTGVQSAVIPLLAGSERQNVLIKSQTGSGKTLAYLLPIVNDLLSTQPPVQRNDGTRAVIIAPTRELCSQIADVLEKLTQCCVNIVGGSITGGEKKKSEKARLRKGIVVLVGTPGRLLDHLKTTESFRLSLLRWVVLDEADRLLDLGFEQTILEILSLVRGERLPGLKAPSQRNQDQAARAASGSLQQRWARQSAQKAKVSTAAGDIVHLMASATLTAGVRQLAGPVMGGTQFAVVDADKETVTIVDSSDELLKISGAGAGAGAVGGNKKATVVTTKEGVVTFADEEDDEHNRKKGEDDEDENEDEDEKGGMGQSNGRKKASTTSLLKGEAIEAPQQLAQYYMMVTCKWRLAALVSFLRAHAQQKVVVFFTTCDSVDFHALLLREATWPLDLDPDEGREGRERGREGEGEGGEDAAAKMRPSLDPLSGAHCTGMLGTRCSLFRLHGSMPQAARQSVFREFSAARSGVLFCTDVAARGLDLPHVDWILQYDPPCETADYVHRVGRTARRGLVGSALLFLLPSEASYTQLLASHKLNPEPLSLQSLFQDTVQHIPGASKFKNTDEITAVILQRRLESVVHGCRPLLGAARQAFRSFVRAYATHSSDTKGIFSVQALHLGHVAKSFGLRESPKALRASDDLLAKINNGYFSSESAARPPKLTREARDQKYALSAAGGGKNKAGKKGQAGKDKDRQKARKMGPSTSSSSSSMGPSGKFRKSGGGYFKKRLREQTQSEFAQ